MRLLPLALVLATTPAVAGPPEYSHVKWYAFAHDKDGLWLLGMDSCDEAGTVGVAARLDGKDVTHDADRLRALDGKKLAADRWRSGKDVYEAGDKPRVSHDAGKTWKPMAGAGELVRAVVGTAPDRVFGIAFDFVVMTTDRGATWDRMYLAVEPRKCAGGS